MDGAEVGVVEVANTEVEVEVDEVIVADGADGVDGVDGMDVNDDAAVRIPRTSVEPVGNKMQVGMNFHHALLKDHFAVTFMSNRS
jgi:hypothetical protein